MFASVASRSYEPGRLGDRSRGMGEGFHEYPKMYVLHGTYGSATSMNEILVHGNMGLFMVVFPLSYG